MCQMCELSFVGFAEPQDVMLDGFKNALHRGWSPHTEIDISKSVLDAIETDAAAYLASVSDAAPLGDVTLPDGRAVPRLPMRIRWIWDGDFCGQINLRWAPVGGALPPTVLGHIGYTVVPWKRGHGIAKRALRHMLSEAREVGLAALDVCTTADNIASQKVILANGGAVFEAFRSEQHDPTINRLRYRISL
jgi:predicted acetyltransferase